MNELIEKIVERLEEELRLSDKEKERCARENPLQFDSAKGYAHGVGTAISIVKELAAEYNDGWIPVERELPEVSGYYLVTEKCFYEARERWYNSRFKKWFCHEDSRVPCDIIAWQYMPEIYQPKGE